jgi:tellurite resistance protein TerC
VQSGVWVGVYLTLAIAFGIGLGLVAGVDTAVQFFAGYLTEYSLSVDNLFVFGVVMASFAVPAAQQARVLLVGIAAALVLRGLFILAGAAAIDRFSATFYLFGVFLIFTAVQLVRHRGVQPDLARNPIPRLAARLLPTTPDYHGGAWTIRVAGRRLLTPMAMVIVAIALCDVMFALDSIPTIFGLTQEPYLVCTANALMGRASCTSCSEDCSTGWSTSPTGWRSSWPSSASNSSPKPHTTASRTCRRSRCGCR